MTIAQTDSTGSYESAEPAGQSPEQLQRVPPHSIEAETCVLGSMVLDAATIDVIVQIARPEHFYRPAHQLLYQVLVDMRQVKKPVDLVTLRDELARTQQLEAIGGIEYVADLVEGVPNAANAEYYAKIVRDKAMLRQLIVVAREIGREAYDSREEAAKVVDEAELRIFEVAAKHIGEDAVDLKDLLQQTFEMLMASEGNLVTGLGTGYDKLNELTSGFQKGDMAILAARPSMGKTSILLNMAEHMAVADRLPVAFFSLEMSKEQVSQRMLASHARFNLRQMRRGRISPEDWSSLKTAAGNLQESRIFVDDSALLTIIQLRAKARRLKQRHDIQCVFLDYLQLMTYSGRASSRQEQITEISRGIKALGRELDVPIVAAAQLNRGPADLVMLLHNEDYYHIGEKDYMPTGITELIIAKQRNGPIGALSLHFTPEYTRFEPAADDAYVPV